MKICGYVRVFSVRKWEGATHRPLAWGWGGSVAVLRQFPRVGGWGSADGVTLRWGAGQKNAILHRFHPRRRIRRDRVALLCDLIEEHLLGVGAVLVTHVADTVVDGRTRCLPVWPHIPRRQPTLTDDDARSAWVPAGTGLLLRCSGRWTAGPWLQQPPRQSLRASPGPRRRR